MSNQIVLSQTLSDDQFQRIESENVLAPGYFWRLKNDFTIKGENWPHHTREFYSGDAHLLLDIFEYEGVAHTVTILSHPRSGNHEYKILVAEFLANFEPEKNADAIRTKEQADVMNRVQGIQEDIVQAQVNPMDLPDMRSAIEKAVEKFEQQQVAQVLAEQKSQEARTTDLRKLHRRAARRSEAAGNPLTVRSMTISDQVGLMIAGGIDSQSLIELTAEAKRRIVIAEETSNWLIKKSGEIATVLKELTPYYAEKGKVALARASKAIAYVKDITQGLTSLKLYTGDGIDVVPVTEGRSALSIEPLTLVQGKRFMDEELAVWADISESFDWRSQNLFFERLKDTPELAKQLFPTQRCVVSMAVTRRTIEYSSEASSYERVMNEIRNRRVFLLARDGENINAVYSTEPSHESAHRLFPTQSEVEGPFKGIDGSKIGLQDVALSASVKKFDDIALHYKRFLILLCGLDHRMRLFGDFYPVGKSISFMTLEFQESYFRFLSDDESSYLIGDSLEPVDAWMHRCNATIKSGSRVVVVEHGLAASSPQLKRLSSADVDYSRLPSQHIVSRVKDEHCITVDTKSRYKDIEQRTAIIWLDGENNASKDWYLCLDMVRLSVLRRYIYSRVSRTANIEWLRAFKRAESLLVSEHEDQQQLRSYLKSTALENNILTADEVDEGIELALSTWRAAHRGANAPGITEKKEVNEILTLMFPSDRIADSTQTMIDALIEKIGATPLLLARTGTNKLVLYVQASEDDKKPFGIGVFFGWVKRLQIDVLKTRASIASSSFVWLDKSKPNAAEIVVRKWTELDHWTHPKAEPCSIKSLGLMMESMAKAECLGDTLSSSRASSSNKGIPIDFFESIIQDAKSTYKGEKYCVDVPLLLPIGVIQDAESSPVNFLYAKTGSASFVKRYGTIEQWEHYKTEVFSRFSLRSIKNIEGESKIAWTMITTTEPTKKIVCGTDVSYKIPEKSMISSYECGGFKRKEFNHFTFNSKATRAQRKKKGGMPRHKRAEFNLSWSRATEALIGIGPHLKAKFYKEKSFWASSKNEKYVAPNPRFEFSRLVWNQDQKRSIANKHFSI